MARKHKPEEIIGKLREAEVVLAQGATTAEACRRIAVSEQTYYRWRKEYGGLKVDQARRMKDLERENARLKRLVADLDAVADLQLKCCKQPRLGPGFARPRPLADDFFLVGLGGAFQLAAQRIRAVDGFDAG